MKTNNTKWALITGASSGIGKSFSELFAGRGYNIILVARNEDRLQHASDELKQSYDIETQIISVDLGKDQATQVILKTIEERNITINALVNNAGYGELNTFTNADWETNQAQINAMLTSVTELCYQISRQMKARENGLIINVASLAAFTPNLPGLVYNGIKSFVVNFTEALNHELKPHGVHCLALCPGLTSTNFPAAMNAEELFAKAPRWRWMSPEQVAHEGYQAVKKGKAIHVPGKLNRALVTFYGVMPFSVKSFFGRHGIIL